MSIHKSLVSKSSLSRHRSVLTRAERVAKLLDEGKWQEGESVFGLPKVKVRRVKTGGKQKKAKAQEGEAAAAEGEAAEAAEAPEAAT
jgi:small basic protein (TIGR04137 family)